MDSQIPRLVFSHVLPPTTTISRKNLFNQNFSFPKPVINYVTDNFMSQKTHEKLVSLSKYFFFVNPYLCGSIHFNFFENEREHTIHDECCFRPTLENIDPEIKFWIINKIFIMNHIGSESLSLLIPRIYRCDISALILSSVNMSFDEFLIISPTVEDVDFCNVKIRYSNGEIVLLEDIIEKFPKLVECSFSISPTEPNISCNTAQRILQSSNFSNITNFCIVRTPQSFDISIFVKALTERELPHFWINIEGMLSSHYELELEECINILINSKFNNRMIQYSEEDENNFMTLLNRYDDKFIRILTMG